MALKLHDVSPQVVILKSMFWRAHPEWGGFGKYASKPEFDSDVRRLVLRLQHRHNLEPYDGIYGQEEWQALVADLAVAEAPNFRIENFRSHDGAEMPANIERNIRLSLLPMLVKVQAAWDRHVGFHDPLVVISGHRSLEWNRHVGGVEDSLHPKGLAADVRPKSGKIKHFQTFCVSYWKENIPGGIGGLGIYASGHFCHLDTGHHRIWKQ